jgi:hypothetical protein
MPVRDKLGAGAHCDDGAGVLAWCLLGATADENTLGVRACVSAPWLHQAVLGS